MVALLKLLSMNLSGYFGLHNPSKRELYETSVVLSQNLYEAGLIACIL